MRFIIVFILIIGAALGVGYYFGYDIGFERALNFLKEKNISEVQNNTIEGSPVADLIHVTYPIDGAVITSPLKITGEARGTWYFEASFPIILVDWDGRIIAEHYAQAQGEWMTEDFVPFEGMLEFEKPYDDAGNVPDFMKRGALILKKDNPSGLPQHDNAIEIPILFE